MQEMRTVDMKTVAAEIFAKYAEITSERSRKLLAEFYNKYVPRWQEDVF